MTVFPYTDSTQSGGVLTSFALGKPVIVSDLETMRELVEEGRHGYFANPRDAKSLADSIIKFLLDDKKSESLKNYILSDYYDGEKSWTYIANKYIEVFNSLKK